MTIDDLPCTATIRLFYTKDASAEKLSRVWQITSRHWEILGKLQPCRLNSQVMGLLNIIQVKLSYHPLTVGHSFQAHRFRDVVAGDATATVDRVSQTSFIWAASMPNSPR
jgi:hypothetical protein